MWNMDDDVSVTLRHSVPRVLVDKRLALERRTRTSDREKDDRLTEHPYVLREQIVDVEPNLGEVPNTVELEENLDRLATGFAS